MSLSIDAIQLGIVSAYQASTLPALLGDDFTFEKQRFFFIEAKEDDIAMPYITYNIVDSVPGYRLQLLNRPIETMRLSFLIHDDQPSPQSINEISAEVEEVYGSDAPALPLGVTYKDVRKERILTFLAKFNGVWVYTLDFQVTLERL